MAELTVLRLEGYLVVTIGEDLSDAEAETLQVRLLEDVVASQAKGVLIDISGMDVVDSYFCRVLRDTAAMSRLMGAPTVLTGLRAPVAVTLTELGLDLEGIHTDQSLEQGLDWLRHQDRA